MARVEDGITVAWMLNFGIQFSIRSRFGVKVNGIVALRRKEEHILETAAGNIFQPHKTPADTDPVQLSSTAKGRIHNNDPAASLPTYSQEGCLGREYDWLTIRRLQIYMHGVM